MATANEELRDSLLRHQIYLLRLSGSIRNEILAILDATEADLRKEIARRGAKLSGGVTTLTIKRLKFLEKVIKEIRFSAVDKAYDIWNERMRELSTAESVFIANAIQVASPAVLDFVLPNSTQLLALVSKRPVEGKTLKQWADNLKRADVDRIMNQVRIGMAQGETGDQMARRVVGTAALRGTNGVTQITRANAEAITRTAVNAFSNEARALFNELNSDIVSEEVYIATLDARTTAICRSLDGKRFKLGVGPRPPLHFNCRSLRLPVIDGQVIGERPARTHTQKQLLSEFTSSRGLKKVTNRDALPFGYKGDFDTFAAKRMRAMTGRVPAATSYQTWLTGQSASFQDDVLGKTKGALFRRGGLTLDRFVNRNGDELTLSELARREAAAFRSAGLDPSEFRR